MVKNLVRVGYNPEALYIKQWVDASSTQPYIEANVCIFPEICAIPCYSLSIIYNFDKKLTMLPFWIIPLRLQTALRSV